jgi:hypothetical protein
MVILYVWMWILMDIDGLYSNNSLLPVVPHKAVAEVSKIGNL